MGAAAVSTGSAYVRIFYFLPWAQKRTARDIDMELTNSLS
jgi:hypothetical protein